MNKILFNYYQKELTSLKQMSQDFAKHHPDVAGNLNLGRDKITDPHIAYMIEAVAMLNARTHKKIDDEFPELIAGLFDMLYPHYQAPIPSMAIIQLNPSSDVAEPFTVKRHTMFETDPLYHNVCRYRTSYDTEVLPLKIEHAKLEAYSKQYPKLINQQVNQRAESVLSLQISPMNMGNELASMAINNLRFYIQAESKLAFQLLELICYDTIDIAIMSKSSVPIFIGRNALKSVGHEPSQAVLPENAKTFSGYRLLTEYFCFPEKFLFFDIHNLDLSSFTNASEPLEILLYLNKDSSIIENDISQNNFKLNCTPVINLFSQHTEPLTLDHTQSEHQVITDVRRPQNYEIYSIDRIDAIDNNGDDTILEFQPFYKKNYKPEAKHYWHSIRRDAKEIGQTHNPGTEVFIGLTQNQALLASEWTLDITATCTNRQLPNYLFSSGQFPSLQSVSGAYQLDDIRWITTPTLPIKPQLDDSQQWSLFSFLSANHLSLLDKNAHHFRQLLNLHQFTSNPFTNLLINSISEIATKRNASPILLNGAQTFFHGLEVKFIIDSDILNGHSFYCFAAVLNQFIKNYASINAGIECIFIDKKTHKERYRWQPQLGSKHII